MNGFSPDRDPIEQAKARAGWLKELIQESTGKTFKVRPVVLYPGWFISKQPKGVEVWVLNPKNLSAFLEHENSHLSPEEAKLAAFHLSRNIRECQKQAGQSHEILACSFKFVGAASSRDHFIGHHYTS